MDTKTCTNCGETKPLGMFHKDPRRADRGGLRPHCKACVAAASAAYRAANRGKVKAYRAARYAANPDTKTCTKCGETKPLEMFHKDPRRADRGGQQRPHCKACEAAASAAYRAANRGKVKAYRAARYAANPGKIKQQNTKKITELKPDYIAQKLRIPVDQLTPELLESKRQQLELHRLNRQLQATLEDLTNGRE